jgi:hypothetical protein
MAEGIIRLGEGATDHRRLGRAVIRAAALAAAIGCSNELIAAIVKGRV